MGKTKTRTDHRSLWLTGRLDLRTSTGGKKGCVSVFARGCGGFLFFFLLWGRLLTPHEDIQDQNDEAYDAAAGSVLGCVRVEGGEVVCDWGCGAEGCEAELEEEGEHGWLIAERVGCSGFAVCS
jgi:hypothetical protein